MTALFNGGPLDGTTVEFDGQPPGRMTFGLPPLFDGGGAADYELRGGVYEFAGWRDDAPPEQGRRAGGG